MRTFNKLALERCASVLHMKSIKKSLAVLAIAGLCVSAFAPVAAARSIGGRGGQASNASQATSFLEDFNGVTWNGSGYARWDMPLVIDRAANYTPTAWVYVNGVAGNANCVSQAKTGDGRTVSYTNWIHASVGNAWTTITPGTVAALSNSAVQISCFLGNGSVIQSVTW
jgi:hypothetical protein